MLSTKSINAADQNADDTRSNSLSECERISKGWNVIGPLRLAIITVIAGLFFIGQGEALAAASVTELNDPVPLYGTFVLQFSAPSATGSKFDKFPQVTFTKGSTSKKVEGFFNGNGSGNASGTLWLARFMPNTQGTWNYTWSFEGSSGSGSLTVGPRSNSKNHGHVKRSGKFLKHDDGTGFYYRGANWCGTINLRASSRSVDGAPRFSDSEWVNYVQRLADTGHNGSWMANMENTMNNDRASFDLAWMKRVDWAIEQGGKRGLYMFLTIFNTWGRSAGDPFVPTQISSEQLLDPWNGSKHQVAKKFLLRYLMARYAGYYNVMWELGNELEANPNNSVSGFISAANGSYIPWMRQYDPYDVAITASEGIWKSLNVDIGGLHQNETVSLSAGKPIIHTEFVRGGAPERMWKTTTYRNPAYRHYYRRGMWKGMAEGGSGSIEGSIMFFNGVFNNLSQYLADGNIKTVMQDHGRLGQFMDAIPHEMFDLPPLGSGIGSASQQYKSRGQAGKAYLAYFYGGVGNGVSLNVNIGSGSYRARWFSPSTGQYSSALTVSSGERFSSPWSNQDDVALELVSVPTDTTAPRSPVGLTLK